MPQLISNFDLRGPAPNFVRDIFTNLEDLLNDDNLNDLPRGFIAGLQLDNFYTILVWDPQRYGDPSKGLKEYELKYNGRVYGLKGWRPLSDILDEEMPLDTPISKEDISNCCKNPGYADFNLIVPESI